ncbi:ERMES complex subunit [Microbotryomycetes sp. JL221]|nr:ERMES complex subunit [Microbotryomycetes sp. JL221]
MSFNFEWPTFSDDFYADAKEMLAQALNKGEKPPIIADRIEVKELNMGTIPPELEILEIGDLSTDRFRGIFRLTYAGDAFIVLQTKVQANPLNVPRPSLDIFGAPRILFAAAPLVVPMTLRLSNLSLRAIVVLVVSRQKGITLVFKNDPLEAVNVSSSFDGVESVAGFIQTEIEAQLREAFRSDLPSVIHRLSQKWLSGEVKTASQETAEALPRKGNFAPRGFAKDAKIQTRTAYMNDAGDNRGARQDRRLTTRMSTMSLGAESVSVGSDPETSFSVNNGHVETRSLRREASIGRRSAFGSPTKQRTTSNQTVKPEPQSVPESIESYDPTYGLRPDSIPMHAGFGQYHKLVQSGGAGRGLGGVLEQDPAAIGGDEDATYGDEEDLFEFDPADNEAGLVRPASVSHQRSYQGPGQAASLQRRGVAEYEADLETIPAVGGGMITRPRILHTQSQMRTRAVSNSSLSAHGSPSTMTAHVPESTTSTIGDLLGSPPFRSQLRDDRFERLASQSHAGSGTSTPRFPFPRMPSKAPSFASAPIASRQASTYSGARPSRAARAPHQLHRSGLSQYSIGSTRSMEEECDTRAIKNRDKNNSQPRDALVEEGEPEAQVYPRPRPDPIELLSRSPSSVLNNSYDDDLGITVNPTVNDSCAHLATLTHSNQTLSPFTRSHEHFTARSSPHVLNRGMSSSSSAPVGLMTRFMSPRMGSVVAATGVEGGASGSSNHGSGEAVKANRKRVYRIGSANKTSAVGEGGGGSGHGSDSATDGGRASSILSPMMVAGSRNGSSSFDGGKFSRRSSLLTRGTGSARSSSLAPSGSRVRVASTTRMGSQHGRSLSLDTKTGLSGAVSSSSLLSPFGVGSGTNSANAVAGQHASIAKVPAFSRRSFVTIQRPFTSVTARQQQQQTRQHANAKAVSSTFDDEGFDEGAAVDDVARQSGADTSSSDTRTITKSQPKPTRALLYVPGSNLKMLKKALAASSTPTKSNGSSKQAMDVPDALILDLEDSVAAGQKGEARRNVFDVLQSVGPSQSQLFVRINSHELGDDDLEVILKASNLDGVVIPKVNTVQDVLNVDRAIEEHASEQIRDSLRLIASIESPLALVNLKEIATCSNRVEALLFAAEDYCAASNLVRTESRQEMLFARSSVVTVAKAFGLSAIDLVRTAYKGPEAESGLRIEADEGRKLGFDGKQAIHPAQVATIQRSYTPSETEIQRAQKILAQYSEASDRGRGAYGLEADDGSLSMIDAPMASRSHASRSLGGSRLLIVVHVCHIQLLQAEKILAVAKAAGVKIAAPANNNNA